MPVLSWSAAKGTTYYTNDAVGNLTYIKYPSSTSVNLKYDWLNRLTNMVDAAGTTKYTYTAGNQLLTEIQPFSSSTVTNTFVNRLRTAMSLQQPSGVWTNGFIYDAAARLTNVTSQAGTFGRTLATPGSQLIRRVSLPNTSYIINAYDPNMWRLTRTYLKNSANTTLDYAAYGFNQANQRTSYTNLAGTYVQYAYDNIGQLKVATSSVSSENRGYTYDAAWNLNWLTNTSAHAFTVDNKNELTSWPYGPGTYDGNGNRVTQNSGSGATTLSYDDENRLTSIIQSTAYNSGFIYDGLGRLRERIEYTWTGSSWYPNTTTYYLYDGTRVIQERDSGNTPTVSYTRGTDLSGSLEGAGGIGGLLARSSGYSGGSWSTHYFYHADGNGNITYLVDSSQAMAATYRYDAFGNMLSSSGTMSGANVYRFSSKEQHLNSGMYVYLYRFYDPLSQRWLNRDPIAGATMQRDMLLIRPLGGNGPLMIYRKGNIPEGWAWIGPNLYRYSANDPANYLDPYGLCTLSLGITFSVQAGPLNITFSTALAVDSQRHFGGYFYAGPGAGLGAGMSGGLSVQGSNAQSINDLGGWFGYASLGGGFGGYGSLDTFWGNSDHGPVFGGGATIGVGLGGGAAAGATYTWPVELW